MKSPATPEGQALLQALSEQIWRTELGGQTPCGVILPQEGIEHLADMGPDEQLHVRLQENGLLYLAVYSKKKLSDLGS